MTAFAELSLEARTEELKRAIDEIRKIGDAGDQAEKQVSKATSLMGIGFGKLAKAAAAALAPLASGALLTAATREAEKFQTTMFRIEAVIAATGGAAGRSADQLREQARQIASTTLESTEGILQAQQVLLTFRNVQGEVFDRAINASADLAAAMGGDVVGATRQLARALEDPINGVTALTRSGTVFTKEQREVIKALVETGREAEAQGLILAELEAQYGGVAVAAAQGLAGAQDTLGQKFQELKLALADQLNLLEISTDFNNRLAKAVEGVTKNLPAIIDGFQVFGAVLVGLASTQIPGLIVALTAKTAGMTAAGVAAGVLTGAVRALGTAVAIAGGPMGLLLGILGGAAAAMVLFRDNTDTTSPIMDSAREATEKLNAVLANSSEFALPAAARETLNLTNENIKLAKSAYAVAEAELEKAKQIAYAAQQQLGAETMSSLPLETLPGFAENQRAIDNLTAANLALQEAQKGLTDRINEGQLALSGAGEAMAEHQTRAIDLKVTMDDLASSIGGGAGAADDGFIGRLQALTQQFQTEREIIEKWRDDAILLMEDRRAMERLGEQGHKEMMLAIEEEYQRRLAELQGRSQDQYLADRQTFFAAATSLMQSENKALFNIGKAAAIAQALLQARESVVASYRFGARIGGPFLGATFAGIAAAATAAQVAQIASTQMNGSGGGSSVSARGGASASAPREPTPAPAQQQRRVIRFDVQGDGMFADMLRENVAAIADAIIDEQRLGGTTILVGRA